MQHDVVNSNSSFHFFSYVYIFLFKRSIFVCQPFCQYLVHLFRYTCSSLRSNQSQAVAVGHTPAVDDAALWSAQPGVTGHVLPADQLLQQLLHDGAVAGVVGHVGGLHGIDLQVVEFKLVTVVVLVQALVPVGGAPVVGVVEQLRECRRLKDIGCDGEGRPGVEVVDQAIVWRAHRPHRVVGRHLTQSTEGYVLLTQPSTGPKIIV